MYSISIFARKEYEQQTFNYYKNKQLSQSTEFARQRKLDFWNTHIESRHGVYGTFFYWGARATSGPGPSHLSRLHEHTQTRSDSSGWVTSPKKRPLLDNTQHSQETDIHAPAGFEPAIPATEWLQTHAIDRAAIGIGCVGQMAAIIQRNLKELASNYSSHL
jgi:hypothetical protein